MDIEETILIEGVLALSVFQRTSGGVWLLSAGVWNDGGIWKNEAAWNDGV